MPYSRLSEIVGGNQLADAHELLTFSQAINHACLILGIVILLAIIPSLLRGPRNSPGEPSTLPAKLQA